MAIHFYLSLTPEALIASMLTPEEFGAYYAVGSEKRSRGQAIFFEVDPKFRSDFFHIEEGIKRCVPHEDGSPKRSIYIAVYRVLENVPMNAIKKLHITTQDGRTLSLDPGGKPPDDSDELHLYREISPVTPLVVSTHGPAAFYDLIVKNPTTLVKLPAICFAELRLGNLATDPQNGDMGDLPYGNMEHLRNCLVALRTKMVSSKMVDRLPSGGISYRTIKNGFFVGNQEKLLYFPLPGEEDLVQDHYRWWRSATT